MQECVKRKLWYIFECWTLDFVILKAREVININFRKFLCSIFSYILSLHLPKPWICCYSWGSTALWTSAKLYECKVTGSFKFSSKKFSRSLLFIPFRKRGKFCERQMLKINSSFHFRESSILRITKETKTLIGVENFEIMHIQRTELRNQIATFSGKPHLM